MPTERKTWDELTEDKDSMFPENCKVPMPKEKPSGYEHKGGLGQAPQGGGKKY